MTESPNYYAILPANIRYAEDLSCLQKLLYAEITALSNKDGFCYASNNYFASLYQKDPTWVSKAISDMQKKWYLKIDREKESWFVRKIFIWELKYLKKTIKTPCRKPQDASCSLIQDPLEEKCKTPLAENCNIILQDNNTTSRIGESTPTSTPKNIEYINWMRSAELKGKQYIRAWNELTWDSSIMSSEVKKGIYNIQNSITAEDFKLRAEKFTTIRDLIVRKKMQNYFYYPIWNWTLENFLEHINKFYWDDSIIISRIAKKEEVQKALRVLSTPSTTTQPVEEKIEMTEEQKARSLEIMNKAREKLLHHTT